MATQVEILGHKAKIERVSGQTKSGLVLPGQPGFEAVPEAVIKGEIEKHGRFKP